MGKIINVAIVGYGNVGRGALGALIESPDMTTSVILTRRPDTVRKEIGTIIPVRHINDYRNLGEIPVDVAILCGGSKKDLWEQGPMMAEWRPTVDSFDTHRRIPWYLRSMNDSARKGGNPAIIAEGWDPGYFSRIKAWGHSSFNARVYTFYGLPGKGPGLSMGHSNAIRDNVPGVLDARSYTHAILQAIEKVLAGQNPDFDPGDMHWRENFVVAEEGANQEEIDRGIRTMADYFAGYRTEVKFITQEEMDRDHYSMSHNGMAVVVTETSPGKRATIKFECEWDDNPEATAHILVSYLRAVVRMKEAEKVGAFTVLDIPDVYLTPYSRDEAIKAYVLIGG